MAGIGVMLHALSGGSPHPPSEYVGETITAAEMAEEALILSFGNGKKIKIFDDGQSCCENRYMRTDDDVQSLVGQKLTRIEAKEAPKELDEYGGHEVCFVEVGTDQGHITITNHNEHNGYYGGFGLSIVEVQ